MFEHRETLAGTPARAAALDALAAGIRAADPERAVRDQVGLAEGTLRVADAEIDLAGVDRVLVLGGGKAAAAVARGLHAALGDRLTGGCLVVPEADVEAADGSVGPVDLLGGGHPVPTDDGAAAAERVRDLAASADERTLVLAVVTGGASALLAAPAGDLSVDDLRATTRALLDAGVDVGDLNAVRKHCSAVKGGRLAEAVRPARLLTLLCSDVVGDDSAVVGSGPTVPDGSTFGDALAVLDDSGASVPRAVREHLDRGDRGTVPETPDGSDGAFERDRVHLLCSNRTAVVGAAEAARRAGYEPLLLSTRVRGGSEATATSHAAVAEEIALSGDPVEPPAVILSGGETTVQVDGEGRGGPNTAFALATALDLADAPGVAATALDDLVVAAVDTDGLDGSTDVAGGLLSPSDLAGADRRERARAALADDDSLGFLEDLDAVLGTGPTGTNVNDLRIVVVPE